MTTDDSPVATSGETDQVLARTPINPSGSTSKKRSKKRTRYRSPQRRIAVACLQIALVSYFAFLLLLVSMETRMVYPGAFMKPGANSGTSKASIVPVSERLVSSTGPSFDSDIETVQYESTDGITLSGRLLECGHDKPIMLIFHGNMSKAVWLDPWLQDWSSRLDANVMAAEYRGYEDDATPTEKGLIADSIAARDFLCHRYDVEPDEIILYGNSLGGGCAVAVASLGGAKALVLDRTFDRMVEIAAGKYPYLPIRWLMKNRFDSLAKLTVYEGPLIVVHGTDDTLIPIENAKRLYDSSRSKNKKWIEVPGLNHEDPKPPAVVSEMAETLRRFTTSEPQESPEPSQPASLGLRVSN